MSIAYTFLFKYHSLLHILRFLFFFSDNIMADVASKQQTTALFLSTIFTCTRRHTELIKKPTNLMGNLCCAREHSVQVLCSFFYTVKLHSLTSGVWGPLQCTGPLKLPREYLYLTGWLLGNEFHLSGIPWVCKEFYLEQVVVGNRVVHPLFISVGFL
jgi:hypothetical protein